MVRVQACDRDDCDVRRAVAVRDYVTFDCETAPLPDDRLRELLPEFVPPPAPGEFDPESVKYGNTKDPAKRAEKLADERAKHAALVGNYATDVEIARGNHFADFQKKAALDATTGRVVAIGIGGYSSPVIIDCDGEGEELGLKEFWGHVETWLAAGYPIITFNGHSFDIPFLRQRSWVLGVPVPLGVMQGRYPAPAFIDIMREWTCHQQGKYIKLQAVAIACGLAAKASGEFTLPSGEVVLVDGENFAKAWRRPDCRKLAEEYLAADLRIPAEVAERMGII